MPRKINFFYYALLSEEKLFLRADLLNYCGGKGKSKLWAATFQASLVNFWATKKHALFSLHPTLFRLILEMKKKSPSCYFILYHIIPRNVSRFYFNTTHTMLTYIACFVNSNSIFFCFSAEEMACLATWKEGSSRYFVSMLNHSHVYTDETRYRCFVYQRQHSNELGRVTYKMAQSLYASCLGLWNVNEGHKTFTMTKCKLFLICFFFWQSVIVHFDGQLGFSENL
jgi:hypothetical protein